MTNYLRKCSLLLDSGQIDLGSLRVVFKIEASSLQSPNMGRFRVYNVGPSTAAKLAAKEFSNLSFSAGYEQGAYGLIYKGNIKQAIIGHETAVDSYVDIFTGDGDHGYNGGYTNQTLSSGYTPQDVFDVALKSLGKFGITKGNVTVDLSQPKFPRGRPIFELARDTLRTLASSHGTTWSIQDGRVDMIDPNVPLGTRPFVMNSGTGLIGWPRQTQDGIIVTSLLNPALRPNSLVQINQSSIIQAERDNTNISGGGGTTGDQNKNLDVTGQIAADGIYRVYYMERSGDTRGNDWYDISTCLADGTTKAAPNDSQAQTYPLPEGFTAGPE